MPCKLSGHNHVWPESGPLTIEKCERYCSYCTGDAAEHEWKFAWFLRRHVRTVHLKGGDKPNVVVADGWSDKPEGMRKTLRPISPPELPSRYAAAVRRQRKNRVRADQMTSPASTTAEEARDVPSSPETESANENSTPSPAQQQSMAFPHVNMPPLLVRHNERGHDAHIADLSHVQHTFRRATQELSKQGLESGLLTPFQLAVQYSAEADRLTSGRAGLYTFTERLVEETEMQEHQF